LWDRFYTDFQTKRRPQKYRSKNNWQISQIKNQKEIYGVSEHFKRRYGHRSDKIMAISFLEMFVCWPREFVQISKTHSSLSPEPKKATSKKNTDRQDTKHNRCRRKTSKGKLKMPILCENLLFWERKKKWPLKFFK
jgi:hypothetical protein